MEKATATHSSILPGEFYSMEYSPWSHKKLDTTEQRPLSLDFKYMFKVNIKCIANDFHIVYTSV